MAKIDAAEISVQVNAELAALARRMLKMLTELPPVVYDQSEMGYRCHYCDANGDDRLTKHEQACEYRILMADAGGLSNALDK